MSWPEYESAVEEELVHFCIGRSRTGVLIGRKVEDLLNDTHRDILGQIIYHDEYRC